MYRADHIIFFTIICILFSGISVNAADAPFMVKRFVQPVQTRRSWFDNRSRTETVTVFRPSDETDHFSNGVVMIGSRIMFIVNGRVHRPMKTHLRPG